MYEYQPVIASGAFGPSRGHRNARHRGPGGGEESSIGAEPAARGRASAATQDVSRHSERSRSVIRWT